MLGLIFENRNLDIKLQSKRFAKEGQLLPEPRLLVSPLHCSCIRWILHYLFLNHIQTEAIHYPYPFYINGFVDHHAHHSTLPDKI